MYFPVMFSNSFHQPRRTRLCCPNQNRTSFLDLWKLLDEQPLLQRSHPLMRGCPVKPEPEITQKQPWIHRLKIKGYDSSDITVKVDDNKVIVHAIHEEKNGDNMDRYETKRTVNIPDIVNKEKISSFLLDGGHLVITAPYDVTVEKEKVIRKTNDEEVEIDIHHEHQNPVDLAVLNKNAMKLGGENKMTGTSVGNDANIDVADNDRSEEQVEEDVSTSQEELVNESYVERNDSISKGDKSLSNDAETETDEETTVIKGPTVEKDAMENSDRDDDMNLEDTYVITSRPPSPVQVVKPDIQFDKLSVGENIYEDNKTKEKEDMQLTAENDLVPMMDSKDIVDVNGGKVFQLSMNLKNFKPENVSIKFKDNMVSIDAEKELNNDGMVATQKIHRKFMVPENCDGDNVSAKMNDDGFVKILVPLQERKEGQSIEVKKE